MRPLSDFARDLHRIPFIHNGSQPLPSELHGAIMLLGNFDGLHRGHGELVAAGLGLAQDRGVPLAMLQCDPHPRAYFTGASRFRVSTGLAQTHLLAAAGVDLIFAPRFDAVFAATMPDEFVGGMLVGQLHIGGIVVGRDFRFGRQRLGTVGLLQRHAGHSGFSLHIINDQVADERRISTSAVRTAIAAGDIGLATRLLGHAWLTEIHPGGDSGWQFAADQLLPPVGAWPVEALDRAGQHLDNALVDIRDDGQPMMVLPAGTALVKWLPTTLNSFAAQTQGREAYA
jgi:riboflavin kinase/FMN adenylyltransferase